MWSLWLHEFGFLHFKLRFPFFLGKAQLWFALCCICSTYNRTQPMVGTLKIFAGKWMAFIWKGTRSSLLLLYSFPKTNLLGKSNVQDPLPANYSWKQPLLSAPHSRVFIPFLRQRTRCLLRVENPSYSHTSSHLQTFKIQKNRNWPSHPELAVRRCDERAAQKDVT